MIHDVIHESPIVGDRPFTPVDLEYRATPLKGRSVGYKSARQHRKSAQEYFDKIQDNWDIIPVSDVDDIHNYVHTREFLDEIERRNYPSGTKILVISSTPMEGDFDTPDWVIKHDIIGHTISKFQVTGQFDEVEVANKISAFIRERDGWLASQDAWYLGTREPHISDGIYNMLPKDLRRGGPDDVVPDIYAGIFFDEITQEWLASVVYDFLRQKFSDVPVSLIRDVSNRHAVSLFRDVAKWKESMKPGVNVVDLWD